MSKFNVILIWLGGNSWGEGRTYQKVAEQLAMQPEIGEVVCLFCPHQAEGRYSYPVTFQRLSPKLGLLWETRPMVHPSGIGYRVRAAVNRLADLYALSLYLKIRGFHKDNTILWLFPPHPYMRHIAETIPHRLMVAHIVDNFAKQQEDPWLYHYAKEQYPWMTRKADVIITGSELNHQIFGSGRSDCYLFENAVDELFIGSPSPLPSKHGLRPVLGYIGTISKRTDLKLLANVARERPGWDLLIAGRSEVSLADSDLMSLPNVRYLGHVPYKSLPGLIEKFDVCLIPHVNNEYCKSMSPLKLYQYLASGKPIVSTEIEGLGRLRAYIEIAATQEAFVAAVERVLAEDTLEKSQSRINAALKETWGPRVKGMFEVVLKKLEVENLSLGTRL